MPSPRAERRHLRRDTRDPGDTRNAFERDHDRIVFSHAFQRLGGVTQIARGGEDSVFHSRLQHSLKVAQIGRRLAERHRQQNDDLCVEDLDPTIVETACLIHDIGHPPFGHVGEEALHACLTRDGIADGFDANAQSFRIITKLAIRSPEHVGMDLTRATMAASIKYPWARDPNDPYYEKKWSIYRSEQEDFAFAFDGAQRPARNLEAQVMDWADDIAYSIHDLEEFHRCSSIPWYEILSGSGGDRLIDSALEKQTRVAVRREEARALPADPEPILTRDDLAQSYAGLVGTLSLWGRDLAEKYEGTRDQRIALRSLVTKLTDHFIGYTRIEPGADGCKFLTSNALRAQIAILKQITRLYVIDTPAVEAQRHGYGKVVTELYGFFRSASPRARVARAVPSFTPGRLQPLWDVADGCQARFAADCVASLTDAEALTLYRRLAGADAGSILNRIVH